MSHVLQVAQALGVILPGSRVRKRKATAAQACKVVQGNPAQQQQQQQSSLVAAGAAAATAQPTAPVMKKQRKAAIKPPPLPGDFCLFDQPVSGGVSFSQMHCCHCSMKCLSPCTHHTASLLMTQ